MRQSYFIIWIQATKDLVGTNKIFPGYCDVNNQTRGTALALVMKSNNLSRLNWLLFHSMSAKFHVYIAKLFTIMQSHHWHIVQGGCDGGIGIKRWQRPITHFHNISGHKSCNATSVTRMARDNMSRYSRGFPQLLSHLSHCARGSGAAETRQRWLTPLHCEARVETRSQGDTELYLHCFSVSWWSTFSTHWAGNDS